MLLLIHYGYLNTTDSVEKGNKQTNTHYLVVSLLVDDKKGHKHTNTLQTPEPEGTHLVIHQKGHNRSNTQTHAHVHIHTHAHILSVVSRYSYLVMVYKHTHTHTYNTHTHYGYLDTVNSDPPEDPIDKV